MIEVGGPVPFRDRDPAGFEEGGHGRVNILVAAGDRVPELAAERGDGRHGGPANADEMNGVRRARSRFDLLHERR